MLKMQPVWYHMLEPPVHTTSYTTIYTTSVYAWVPQSEFKQCIHEVAPKLSRASNNYRQMQRLLNSTNTTTQLGVKTLVNTTHVYDSQ